MDLDKLCEKVISLAALAASENDGEAANAALQACRLIRTHKLRVCPPDAEVAERCIECDRPFTGRAMRVPSHDASGRAGNVHLKCYQRD
jgi:hypothetical protein